ncbi:small ubiquitin-related modifier 3-like [Ischnura elegans]|uniref:small ubiquitin-related modifier 3-like n=1 Tax=Ischnura elegans TaxID=197161 RepID=UPI001ED87EC9|nr:small ubiquitin-related modifier 3-like [Ischnura elegans]XP_046389580.1 small ubiquitin-related modifier 3-like [Ischnura elegans]
MSEDKKDVVQPSVEHINLKVLGQDGSVIQFKIKTRTPLRKLMRAYCMRVGLAKEIARFRFDGQPITEADTPSHLEMEDGDTIEVYTQQTGGSCPEKIPRKQFFSVFCTLRKRLT